MHGDNKATKPCPYGFAGDADRCTCTPSQLARYAARVSGPLLDRIDMHVEVPRRTSPVRPTQREPETPALRTLVAAARQRQLERAGVLNARLAPEQLRATAAVTDDGRALLERCAHHWQLSSRAVARTLKTARTIADIEADDRIEQRHVAEALQLRQLDRRVAGRFAAADDVTELRAGSVSRRSSGL